MGAIQARSADETRRSESDRVGSLSPARHAHLWRLADGTGLHAPYAQLAVNESTGELCCHLCGHWFRFLGAHVRVHGYTADAYRETMGLMRSRPLTARDLSQQISSRQARRYARSATLRATLETGHQSALARQQHRSPGDEPAASTSPERVRDRRAQLDRGRATVRVRRDRQLARRLAAAGILDLSEYLRNAHAAGVSTDVIREITGLGRERLRRAMKVAGCRPRPRGWNSSAGRLSRASAAEDAAASRVGTEDLHEWLRQRREEGWSLERLGSAVGHSGHWVRWRLG